MTEHWKYIRLDKLTQLNPNIDPKNLNLLHLEEKTSSKFASKWLAAPYCTKIPRKRGLNHLVPLESISFTLFLVISISCWSLWICLASSWISWWLFRSCSCWFAHMFCRSWYWREEDTTYFWILFQRGDLCSCLPGAHSPCPGTWRPLQLCSCEQSPHTPAWPPRWFHPCSAPCGCPWTG